MVEVLLRTRSGRSLGPRLAEAELVAPELLDVEVAAAFRRLLLRGRALRVDVVNALQLLRQWPILRVRHGDLIGPSMHWWANVSAYDAVYLAAADAYGATVITVDGPLARAPVTDVTVENVRVGPL